MAHEALDGFHFVNVNMGEFTVELPIIWYEPPHNPKEAHTAFVDAEYPGARIGDLQKMFPESKVIDGVSGRKEFPVPLAPDTAWLAR